MTPDSAKAARELLEFYAEAGVDAVMDEQPIDRFAEPAPPPSPDIAKAPGARHDAGAALPPPARRPPDLPLAAAGSTASAPLAPDTAVMAARDAARNATSLEELKEILSHFEGCALRTTATRLAFADGNPAAKLMLVGEAPGYEEDRQGLPFVGRSGQLLDRMLKAIGIDRSSVYIANVVPWRPPGNRTPTPQETQICLPFIRRQIELADPDVLVCLGGPSMQTLLEIKDGIMKMRGRWMTYHTGSREIRAMATLHPAYLLRQPLAKRLAWRDFMAIRKALAG
jgi:uracil-DNA glycosylase